MRNEQANLIYNNDVPRLPGDIFSIALMACLSVEFAFERSRHCSLAIHRSPSLLKVLVFCSLHQLV